MKDEIDGLPIIEFVRFKSKVYSFKEKDDKREKKAKK